MWCACKKYIFLLLYRTKLMNKTRNSWLSKMSSHYDTIVVGLGAAGVTAASTLARAGHHVLGLEAQDKIGGRVSTVPFGDGVVELGAEWIHGQQKNRAYELGIRNNVDLKSQEIDFNMFRSDGIQLDETLQEFMEELVAVGFAAADVPPEKAISMGEHVTEKVLDYIKENHPKLYDDKEFVKNSLEFLHLLTNNYCASNDWTDVSARDRYTPLEGHQHMSWHKYGYHTFFDILLHKHNNGTGLKLLEIKVNAEVTQIVWPQRDSGQVRVVLRDGNLYTADNVIVTVSLGVLKELHTTLFSPKLPKNKVQAIEQMSIGVMDKIIFCFDKVWWPKDRTFIGFLWKEEDKKNVSKEDYWVTRIFGASSPMGASNALTLWTSGEVAKLVEALPEETVQTKCMELLQKFLGVKYNIPKPLQIIRSNWYTNPYTRGSYSYDNHTVMIENPNARANLAEPLLDANGRPRVLFAGEATDPTHFSTVHGAADTGFREAMRLLSVGSKL